MKNRPRPCDLFLIPPPLQVTVKLELANGLDPLGVYSEQLNSIRGSIYKHFTRESDHYGYSPCIHVGQF